MSHPSRRHALPRLELVSSDEHVVELVMAAAAASGRTCTLASPSEPWSVLAAPHGHLARIVDLTALSSFSPISAALRVAADGFVLVLPADSHRDVRFHVYSRPAIAALLDDLLPELSCESSGNETERTREILLGETAPIRAVREQVARVASYGDVSVLLLGETGTGKELVAQSIHQRSGAQGAFVAINCAAIPETLFESELFGHDAGAFTGARTARVGLLETAAQGTLFLDEIGEMPMALQAKLLRLLETRTFRRLGSNRDLALEARIVSATNRPPDLSGGTGSHLRRDLHYRLAGFTIELPPLRARLADVDVLASAFLDAFNSRHRRRAMRFSPGAIHRLCEHHWPGNVRELRAIVEQIAIVATSPIIDRDDVAQAFRRAPAPRSTIAPPHSRPSEPFVGRAASAVRKPLRDLERELIVRAFEASQGNLSRAALELGIPRTTLRDKLRRYGIVARTGHADLQRVDEATGMKGPD